MADPLTKETTKEYLQTQAVAPTLPVGAEQAATTVEQAVGEEAIQAAEIAEGTGQAVEQIAVEAPAVAPEAAKVEAITPTQAATVDATAVSNLITEAAGATGSLSTDAQIIAEQGVLSEEATAEIVERELTAKATVRGQLDILFADSPNGETPSWARPAVTAAENMLAARGFSNSTVARDSLYNAIISSAMPIATADAAAEQQVFLTNLSNKNKEIMFNAANMANMDMTNLNNRQMAAVENAKSFMQMDLVNLSNEQAASMISYQAKQQALLSDQSADNAAKQFNATSENQTNQFFANMAASIDMNNASRTDAMTQFNTTNTLDVDKYNAGLEFSRQQFNAQNELVVAQSNVDWRRNMNLVDTASINQANQQNAQNSFNLSNQALTMLWQELRDEAQWAQESRENALTRALQVDVENIKADAEMNAALAKAAGAITNTVVSGTDWAELAQDAWDWLAGDQMTAEQRLIMEDPRNV